MEFNSFNFHPHVAAGIKASGYTTPTPIQAQAIPLVLAGRDVMGLAQTGTGKTAAFALPILNRLMAGSRGHIRALIVAPTRELAEQIHAAIGVLGAKTGLRSITVYGGVNINPQKASLRRGAEIVVACPGRLLDHIKQKTIWETFGKRFQSGDISDAVLVKINNFARIVVCGAISIYNETSLPKSLSVQPFLIRNRALMQGFIVNDYAAKFPRAMVQLSQWLSEGELTHTETIVEGFDQIPHAFTFALLLPDPLLSGVRQGRAYSIGSQLPGLWVGSGMLLPLLTTRYTPG